MKTNVGLRDRLIRLLIAFLLLYRGFFLYNHSALGVGLVVVGSIFLVTGLFGFCGLYGLLGIRTNQVNEPL